MEFIDTLKERNTILFWFSVINLCAAVLMILLSVIKPLEYGGTNAWYKPIKFALSTTILCSALCWYMGYLPAAKDNLLSNWIIVVTLGFEVVYIAWQASRGEASHFNISTPFYGAMFALMGIAAAIATLTIGYIGLKFFFDTAVELPPYYLWAIRFGFILFVIFAFEGFAMGSRLSHTVGGEDGGAGIPFLNWSISHGDLRIAHFIGMHALQVLPLLAWYFLKDVKLTLAAFLLYTMLAVVVLVQALKGSAFFRL